MQILEISISALRVTGGKEERKMRRGEYRTDHSFTCGFRQNRTEALGSKKKKKKRGGEGLLERTSCTQCWEEGRKKGKRRGSSEVKNAIGPSPCE